MWGNFGHNKDRRVQGRELKARTSPKGCWSSCIGFWPTNSTFSQVVLKKFSWVAPASCPCPFPGWLWRWSFLAGKTEWLWLWELYPTMRVSQYNPQTDDAHLPKVQVCASGEQPRPELHPKGWAASPRPEARSLLSTTWLWIPPRAVAPSCPPVLSRVTRCPGVWARPREHRTAPSILSALQAPEADPPAAATKTNLPC